jgi:acid phosphatase family membrane protein YuiD
MRTNEEITYFENPVFLSSICSLFFAQLLKVIILILRNAKKKSAREIFLTLIWKTGGMPSSHSALVAALVTSVGFQEGVGSTLFTISLCLGLIVIRDSVGVRRSAGVQARSLNLLGKAISDRFGIEYHPVKEIQGHAPLEVIVGILLGLLIAVAFCVL